MINVTALNRLLTENADGKIFQRWFITTPNGSLIAYTSPTDIRELRDQAALVLVTWREQFESAKKDARDRELDAENRNDSTEADSIMHTMTMEFDNRNVLVRQLQPKLLLVLEGGVPPGRTRKLQITREGLYGVKRSTMNGQNADSQNMAPAPDARPATSPSGLSEISTATSTLRRRTNILDIHRKKLDALTEVIRRDFEKAQFSMPVDPEDRFF
ncbi:hypothetical protein K461DRAFT_289548 [Myriangium duriaei CBS 260.36]|uniref:Uncharacterized protein n=1 Tax=Myriangium duriaei CBS 260.36 TaxID=1168546 RepID=A0A9P4J930_9PEZI|nr:hypothetical protein K461DRAFT_289548 [Myriangium duriaei CBS 260.36]